MTLDKRRAHFLSILLRSEKPLSLERLANQMGVSRRTLYYDLDFINQWLSDKGLSRMETRHGQGIYLPDHKETAKVFYDEEIVDVYQYHFSKEERVLLLQAKILLDEAGCSMKSFMDLTGMSRGTISKAIKQIKEDWLKLGLTFEYRQGSGYVLEGQEEVKRKLVSDMLSTVLSTQEWESVRREVMNLIKPPPKLYDPETSLSHMIRSLLYEAEKDLRMTLTDEMIELLTLHFLFVVKRVKEKKFIEIDEEEKEVLQQTDAYQSALLMSRRLEKWLGMTIPEDEVCFMTVNLLGSRVHYDSFHHYTESELEGLEEVADRMITDFQNYACVLFDEPGNLKENLISHLKPAYYRLKYSVPIAHDLTEKIKKQYHDIFLLTKRVSRHLELYAGATVPDEEVAYIALHFGGWVTKEHKKAEIRYKAMIVCQNGIGTSNMLKTQLENLIAGLEITDTISLREFHANSYEADIIFSTNFVKSGTAPVIHVPAILTDFDKQQVLTRIHELFGDTVHEYSALEKVMRLIRSHASIHDEAMLRKELLPFLDERNLPVKEFNQPMLTDLLKKDTIQFRENAASWEEAITIAAAPLLEKGSIEEGYIEAMIRNVNDMGPYIVLAPRIALPHARPEDGVKQLGMSLLNVKEPVYFSEKEKHRAQLIIVLAAIDNSTHLKALAQLTDILSKEKAIEQLIAAKDAEEVITIIEHYHIEV